MSPLVDFFWSIFTSAALERGYCTGPNGNPQRRVIDFDEGDTLVENQLIDSKPWHDDNVWFTCLERLVGVGFEYFLLGYFRFLQLNAKGTSGSYDDGADVIVETVAGRLVIQTKKWSKKAPKRAVLEALVGKIVHDGNFAVVIAPGGFRKRAREKAAKLNIKLYDFDNITESLFVEPQIFIARLLGPIASCNADGSVTFKSTADPINGTTFLITELLPHDPDHLFQAAWKSTHCSKN